MDLDEAQLLADFRAKFRVEELLIASTPAWSWSLRPAQATVGAGILPESLRPVSDVRKVRERALKS
jgi:hypothetical protein